MRFSCDKCHTKYSIADHKVQKKVLKIRCKKCSNVIIVRDPSTQKNFSEKSVAGRKPRRNRLNARGTIANKRQNVRKTGVGSDTGVSSPLKRRAQEVASGLKTKQPTYSKIETVESQNGGEHTVVARIQADWLKEIRKKTHEEPVWFAAINGQPIGPVVRSEIISYIREGSLPARGLVWRAGWADWLHAYDVPELQEAFHHTPAPPSTTYQSNNDNSLGFHVSTPFQPKLDTGESLAFQEDPNMGEATVIQSIADIMAQANQSPSSSSEFNFHEEAAFDFVEQSPDITSENEIIKKDDVPSASANLLQDTPAPFQKPSSLFDEKLPSPFEEKEEEAAPSPFEEKEEEAAPSPFDERKPSFFEEKEEEAAPSPFDERKPSFFGEKEEEHFEKLEDAGEDKLTETEEEELFFTSDVGFAKSSTEGVFELTLPPLPVEDDEEEEIEEIDMNDPDIIEIKDTITEKWTSRFALLAILLGVLLLTVPLLVKEKLLFGNLEQKDDPSKYTVISPKTGKTRKLTKEEIEARRYLLEGKVAPRLQVKVRRKRRVRRRSGVTRISSLKVAPLKTKQSLIERIQEEARCRALKRLGKSCKKVSTGPKTEIPAGLSKEMYDRLVKSVVRHQGKVKYCYEKYLRGVLISGKLIMELKIAQSGRVIGVRTITRRFRGKKITRCIKRNMKHWRFPAFTSNEPIRLQVPYDLRAIF